MPIGDVQISTGSASAVGKNRHFFPLPVWASPSAPRLFCQPWLPPLHRLVFLAATEPKFMDGGLGGPWKSRQANRRPLEPLVDLFFVSFGLLSMTSPKSGWRRSRISSWIPNWCLEALTHECFVWFKIRMFSNCAAMLHPKRHSGAVCRHRLAHLAPMASLFS